MDPKKKAKLEAAGWAFGDAGDFLALTPAERQLVALRVRMGSRIRTLRERAGMSQKELAAKLGTTQPRVVKIERADADVSLDWIARGVLVLGGRFPTLRTRVRHRKATPRAKAPHAKV